MNHKNNPSPSRNKKNGKQAASSLGPVNNLEAYLQPDWWRRIFNSMYLKTDADVVEDKKITSFELDLFNNILNMDAGHVILDLACGQGRHALELSRRGFRNVYGLDRFHDEYVTDSERKQDLGMMERRILITSEVIKEWSPVKQKITSIKNVAVILGDPQKRDQVKPDAVFDDDDFNTIDQLKMALSSLKNYRFSYFDNHDTLINTLLRQKPQIDFALNLCDEGFNNIVTLELHVPALLEMLKIPYTGSNPQCLAYCYDKSLIRGIAKEMDIPVADAFYIKPEDNIFEMNIGFPVIVKPNYGDRSFGISQKSVAGNVEELNDAIIMVREKLGYDKPLLVEEFLPGKDLTLGIIGNPPESYTVLPIVEEDYYALPDELPRICGYEAKWLQDSPYFKLLRSIETHLEPETEKQIVASSLKLAERLDIRDYVRFDWRLDQSGNPKLLEVNPNPGWCWDGHLAKMAAIRGTGYAELLQQILEAAELRFNYQLSSAKMKKEESTVPN
ncbi:MAG: hypothetical protein P1P82_03310 [Bacteroidales bacterium]|nr:hypothetical protein [Bacteroidales bacterium]MDT8430099.1 hypothetical protein [Bacteroidales bacterium]